MTILEIQQDRKQGKIHAQMLRIPVVLMIHSTYCKDFKMYMASPREAIPHLLVVPTHSFPVCSQQECSY